MTAAHCEDQINRLRMLKGQPEDTFEYFAALRDIPDARFTAAVSHAMKTRVWFPTPAELRADCDAVAPSLMAPREDVRLEPVLGGPRDLVLRNPFGGAELRINVTRVWRFDCDDCSDTGWRSQQCPEIHCGRRFEHGPHEWVERCFCIHTNPTIRRRKEAGAKYSQSPEKVGA